MSYSTDRVNRILHVMMGIQEYSSPLFLINSSGKTVEFTDLCSMAYYAFDKVIYVARYHVEYHIIGNPTRAEWIARDFRGRVILEAHLQAALRVQREINRGLSDAEICDHTLLSRTYRSRFHQTPQAIRAAELGLPIPNTGKRGRGNWYRRPHHIASWRDWDNLEDAKAEVASEYGVNLRGKAHRPPSSWEDRVRADHRNRNWKEFRKTRWISRD